MKMTRIFGMVFFLTGLLVLLTPRYILPTCEYQGLSRMACTYTGKAEMFVGAIIMLTSLGMILSGARKTLRWSGLSTLAAGISVILLPESIGYCHNSQHPCNYGTIPVLRLLGGLVVVLSIACFIMSLRGEKK